MKRLPKTVIVDTGALTDGSLRLAGFTPFQLSTQNTCEVVAQNALFSAPSHLAECLRHAFGDMPVKKAHRPIANYQTSIIRTVWHHGAEYMSYCIGPVADIARLSDLTENEREFLAATSNRLSSEGKIAYGLARGLTKIIPATVKDYHAAPLEFIGIVAFEPILHPKTIMVVEKLRDAGTRIVYLSRDSAATVDSVAHAAHIPSQEPAYSVPRAMHTSDMDLVATIPSRHYELFVERYGKEAQVIAHDLTELL